LKVKARENLAKADSTWPRDRMRLSRKGTPGDWLG